MIREPKIQKYIPFKKILIRKVNKVKRNSSGLRFEDSKIDINNGYPSELNMRSGYYMFSISNL